ncbi:TRM11 family SAM-dependent methyltransferase [Saccharibacillus kuerlensis]|uniref:Methyltransferase n=1 Tax=Saccharibacillus kuerlensis TaxID=459527 RepID=A0ABQ2L1F4_9BACL|nr:hypothetical protein [Saccharibacillus kuerlensis]GGN99335.1 methyltransferase [Saccharibacillus kuerlensis]
MGLERYPAYLYDFACHEEERPLCEMELRTLFDSAPCEKFIVSNRRMDPSRSPFVHGRLAVEAAEDSLKGMAEAASRLELDGQTFKLRYIAADGTADYTERRRVERIIGAHFRGRADMKTPQRLYGIAYVKGIWLLGAYKESEAVWLYHNEKPRQYSTALGTRMARAVVNIAVPQPEGVTAVDPCCGIGTVLIEAKSMGIQMDGFDLNPLAAIGARENLTHFGLPGTVGVADMRTLQGKYDALVLDLPYNLCSVLTTDERFEMLLGARRLADRCLIVATEDIETELEAADFFVSDRCVVRKGRFARYIFLVVSK